MQVTQIKPFIYDFWRGYDLEIATVGLAIALVVLATLVVVF